MQMIVRKVYLSIMVSILCMITLVTVTFAWVGFLDFSKIENFEINLSGSELEEYGIEISLTGEEGSFGSSVDAIQLRRIILSNSLYYGKNIDNFTDKQILDNFNDLRLDQCSVIPNDDKSFPEFKDVDDKNTKLYFKFDIYISPFRAFEGDDNSDYYLNAYLKNNLLVGTLDTRNLINKFTYPSDFVNNIKNGISAGTEISKNITVDSSSACRVSIQKYNVVEKGKPEQYDTVETINDLVIFQGGTSNPTFNSTTGVHSFGGIVKDEYNLALFDYNSKFPEKAKKIPSKLFERGDIEYFPNYQIVDSSKTEEKIGINQMMKMTICFWFEGWDADCFNVIGENPVTINLAFSTNDR